MSDDDFLDECEDIADEVDFNNRFYCEEEKVMEQPRLLIEKDSSGNTYGYTLYDAYGDSVLSGDGYDSPQDIVNWLMRLASVWHQSEVEIKE